MTQTGFEDGVAFHLSICAPVARVGRSSQGEIDESDRRRDDDDDWRSGGGRRKRAMDGKNKERREWMNFVSHGDG